jgi:hypothetical protein
MASVKLAGHVSRFAVIRVDGEGFPISFPLGNRLSLWFQLNINSLHIDEEVYDSMTGDLSYIVGQLLVCNGDGKHWLLGPKRFRLYGLSESVMAATTSLATPLSPPNCTI